MNSQLSINSSISKYFQHRVVWLIGASRGIGEALARELALSGIRLAISARSEEELKELANELGREDVIVKQFAMDVTDKEQIAQAHQRICEELGPVDILIANAGTHIPTDVSKFDVAEYQKLFQINFFGALNCIEVVLESMRERKTGQIVGVASLAGFRGLPKAAAYGASKAALTHFLESVRFDLEAEGISVSIVQPGFVRTPLTDKNDFPMPFLMESNDAASIIARGIAQRKKEISFPWQFATIMKFLRILPFGLYHAFIRKTVAKQ